MEGKIPSSGKVARLIPISGFNLGLKGPTPSELPVELWPKSLKPDFFLGSLCSSGSHYPSPPDGSLYSLLRFYLAAVRIELILEVFE